MCGFPEPGTPPYPDASERARADGSGGAVSSTPGNRRTPRLPALGRRGEGWLVGQVLLIAAVLLSALAGRGWARGYAVGAYAAGGMLLLLGLLLLAAAGLELGSSLTPLPAPRADRTLTLTTTGLYGLARHPMYGGGILIALGWTIIFASVIGLALTVALTLFLDLKARREELWLTDRFAGYGAYRQRTRRKLLPFIY
jgi:protein-S-isoprenylcysteine O-methyltransferase Ste14